jgi:hypothetical protein
MPAGQIGPGLTDAAEVSPDVQMLTLRDQRGNRSRDTAAQRVPLLTVPAGDVLCRDPADLLELPARPRNLPGKEVQWPSSSRATQRALALCESRGTPIWCNWP